MSVRTLSQDALIMSLTIVAVAGISSAPSAAYAKSEHEADIQIANKTGREIQFVTVAHKYSNDYKNTKTWGNLPNGVTTKEPLVAEYNTGIGTTGKDWWIVTWQFKGDNTLYVTSPKNFRDIVDHLEKWSKDALPIAGKLGGAALGVAGGTAAGVAVGGPAGGPAGGKAGGAVGGAIGGKAATEMGALLLNSESTVGFKQHILREKDSKQKNARPTVIEIGDKEVKFNSPSGDSSTGFHRMNGKK